MKEIEILGKLSELATPDELPIDFFKYCKAIWEAFHLGREYQKADGEKVEDKLPLGISPSARKEERRNEI